MRGGRAQRGPRAAHELKVAFAELGPTYVKLAQLIASSPGLFPEVLSDEFRSLLDEVPPIDAAAVREVIEADLGGIPEEVFAEFDYIPLASASIAQVHVARLHDGEEVVVKIQRPGIRARLEGDLRILMRLAKALERLSKKGRMANPIAVVEDFEPARSVPRVALRESGGCADQQQRRRTDLELASGCSSAAHRRQRRSFMVP